MYDDAPISTVRPDGLRRLDACPRSESTPTKPSGWHLERWKAVRDLIAGWYSDDRPDDIAVPALIDAQCGWLDPVQRMVVERLFAGWRAIYPKEADVAVDLDPDGVSVLDEDAGVLLRVQPTMVMERPDGSVERIRLRTGQSGSGLDDAAVLASQRPAGVFDVDAFVASGVAEEVVAPEDPTDRLRQLVSMATIDRRSLERTPGLHCFSCASGPRCGQYPLVGDGRIYGSTRSVTLSKTQLGWLDVCQRRVAWDRIHQVPRAVDDDLEQRQGLILGQQFHEMAAAAILADDPDLVVEAACRTGGPSESAELLRLWENHRRLCQDLELRATEYHAGLTMVVPGVHVDSRGKREERPVAVTLIGILDATGREPDGTPVVVEHRTGRSSDHTPLEAELYAVSAALAIHGRTGSLPEQLAVHLHGLRAEEPTCERTLFTMDDLRSAEVALRSVALMVAAWDPTDSLQPPYTAGSWCGSCHHQTICESFR